jgi:hypothetical protein
LKHVLTWLRIFQFSFNKQSFIMVNKELKNLSTELF